MASMEREPCPDRILDDIGGAFAMGAVGGSAFYFIKGLYNSPSGFRLSGGAQAVRMSAPRTGGGFAVWGGLFSTFDCALVYARQKEDPWNSILAGAATGGLLSLRQGLKASGRHALIGGVLLTLIEGVSIAVNKGMSDAQNQQALKEYEAASLPPNMGQLYGQVRIPETSSASESGSGSWFGGWFGSGKKKESEVDSGSKTQILESFDAPPVPTYEF